MLYRATLAVIVALILGVCIVGSVQTSASAQVEPSPEVLNEQQVRDLRKWLDNTRASDFEKRDRWRRIFTRSGRSAFPTLSRTLLTKGGLAGVAAGVWIHNGVTLYTGLQGPEDPKALVLDSEFRQAEQDLQGVNMGSAVTRAYDNNGTLTGSGMITYVSFKKGSDGSCVVSVTAVGTSTVSSGFGSRFAYGGLQTGSTGDQDCNFGQMWYAGPTMLDPTLRSGDSYSPSPRAPFGTRQFYASDSDSSGTKDTSSRPIGPEFSVDQGFTWQNPVYDWGGSTVTSAPTSPEYTPASGDHVATPEETKTLYDAIKADPEYDPVTDDVLSPREEHDRRAGELVPQHGDKVWTRENPDGSFTTRFADGTEFTSWPDGTELLRRADGTEEWTYPDGTTRTANPDGSEVTRWPDGTTRTRTSDGTEEWTDPTGAPRTAPSAEEYPEPPAHTAPGAPGGPTNQDGDFCAKPRQFTFDIPKLELLDKFPFSLVKKVWDFLNALAAPPSAPSWNLPVIGQVSVPGTWDGPIQSFRGILKWLCGVGMSLWFYRYITGKGSE